MRALVRNRSVRQYEFVSEDEWTANMMCVAAMGREASVGQFRLGRWGDTTLRVRRTDGKQFHEDPIYTEIRASLDRFARELTDDPTRSFINPFPSDTAGALGAKAIGLSHPLGGCGMGPDAEHGVVVALRQVALNHAEVAGLDVVAVGVPQDDAVAAFALRLI